MDIAKSVAMYISELRDQEQAKQNIKRLFQREENRVKLALEMRLQHFYNRVEGFINPGELLMIDKETGTDRYIFGHKRVSISFNNTNDEDVLLIANLNVENGRSYEFNIEYDGRFYWEYKGQELTEDEFDQIMFVIITGN